MGKKDKRLKPTKSEDSSSGDEMEKPINLIEEVSSEDDDEEANEDLSLKIVEKAKRRAFANSNPQNDGVSGIVMNLNGQKKENIRKKKKSKEIVADEDVSEIDSGFKIFCGELFEVDNVKDRNKVETDKATDIAGEVAKTNPVEGTDNAVLRKLLRGPRYFDPPENSWGSCYNCGEEGHAAVNCTAAKRKKPCFVCGSLEHNAKQCSKGKDCYICKQQGHRAKDCPSKNTSKMCLKCGYSGHDMFACMSNYSADDLKEIQCYICHRFGHLCCVDYTDPGTRESSCYRCGLSGHTGLACGGSYGDITGASASSCYKCGEEGHFARECMSSKKAGKRNRELSTPKQRSSKKSRDHVGAMTMPCDLYKTRKKKKTQSGGESMFSSKAKQRGGWIVEDPGDLFGSRDRANNWRSPATPSNRRTNKLSDKRGDSYPGSHSSRKPRKLNFSSSTSNGSAKSYHRFSASRFGNSSNDGTRRNYDWW